MFEGIQIRGVRQKQIHKGILLGKIFGLGVDTGMSGNLARKVEVGHEQGPRQQAYFR